MGTTPMGLPYPEPTAPLKNGADAIRDLALGVETIVPAAAWVPVGYSDGWGDYGGTYAPVAIYKVGKSYLLNGMFKRTGATIASTAAAQTFGYVPEGTLPKYDCLWIVGGYNGSAYVNVRVDLKRNGLMTCQWVTAAAWSTTTWVSLSGLAYPIN